MDKALSATYPGSTITYRTSSGGLANARLLSENKVPLALIADHEVPTAWRGLPPFKKPVRNIRLLFKPYVGKSRFYLSHVIANKEWADKLGIKSFADLGAKRPKMRLVINRPGNNDSELSLALLRSVKLDPSSLAKSGSTLIRAASREAASLLLDRRVDVVMIGISYNHPRIREMASGLGITMLPVEKDVATKVGVEWGGQSCLIKAKEYAFLATDSYAPCVGMGVYVNASADDKLVTDLMSAFFNNVDQFKSAHRLLAKVVSPTAMAEKGMVPHHPAAEKFLRSKGLLK